MSVFKRANRPKLYTIWTLRPGASVATISSYTYNPHCEPRVLGRHGEVLPTLVLHVQDPAPSPDDFAR